MAHGGTNFGFYNGANAAQESEYTADLTSYDYVRNLCNNSFLSVFIVETSYKFTCSVTFCRTLLLVSLVMWTVQSSKVISPPTNDYDYDNYQIKGFLA